MTPVLQVNNLQVSYYTDAGRARALDGVNLTLAAGEKLGLVLTAKPFQFCRECRCTHRGLPKFPSFVW